MTGRHDHAALVDVGVGASGWLLASPGVRGFPRAAPGLVELLAAIPELRGAVGDVTASAGGGALAAAPRARVTVLEPSFAALAAAAARFADDGRVTLEAGLPWDLDGAAWDAVVALPPGERGNDRVRAELAACAAALAPNGVAYAAMHKDLGARRYERAAAESFGSVEVIARSKGWRVTRLARPREESDGPGSAAPWRRFEALGRTWWALPGVFAARGLDAGSAELVAALGELGPAPLAGAEVLDLGCGTGLLSVTALQAGAARVSGVDDDLAAVRSARRNLAGARARVEHSDLDAALAPDERFDAVISNPPFHVGKQVRPALSRAFVRTAHARLRPGGQLLMVANAALPYERELRAWRACETLRVAGGFKVLRARR